MLVDKEDKKCGRRMVSIPLGWSRGQCKVLNPAAAAGGEAVGRKGGFSWQASAVGRGPQTKRSCLH